MRKSILTIILTAAALLAGCGTPEEPPQIQAIPENPADMSVAGFESVDIVPGLSRRILIQGEGPMAEVGHTAVVHYTGWLYDPDAENFRGAKFDSSVDRGPQAFFDFPLGGRRVIRGWDEGVVGMQVGEVRELTIAPEMGYGERGAGAAIPPNSTLVFVVELIEILGLDNQN